MAGKALTDQTTMQCPHGASISATASGRAKADGGTILTIADSFSISGCPFQIPVGVGTVPSPCTLVAWIVPDLQVRSSSTPTLSETSIGLCIAATGLPQGVVSVVNTQSRASTR
jgi:hypothetical protein